MSGVSFGVDYKALLLVILFSLIVFLLWRLWRSRVGPTLFFSNVADLVQRPPWRVRFSGLPHYLMLAAIAAFVVAFIDPHLYVNRQVTATAFPTEGSALYLLADQSGSMRESVIFTDQQGRETKRAKIDLLKEVTAEFVKGRPEDLIGLIAFARVPHVLSPLTLDHAALLQKLAQLQVVSSPNEDGTAIGYALFKAATIIAATRYYAGESTDKERPAYEMKSANIILITDGFDEPSPLDSGNRLRNIDPLEAAQHAKEQGVRIYIINVEPALGAETFGPQRRQLQRAAELAGGRFFLMDRSSDLSAIFAEIDQLEKTAQGPMNALSKEQQPELYKRVSFYPYLIALGMLFLMLSVLFDATLLRRVP